LCLAAAAVGLGEPSEAYLRQIVPPVLASFTDQDSRVRYYACEALYNIAKVRTQQHTYAVMSDMDMSSLVAAAAAVAARHLAKFAGLTARGVQPRTAGHRCSAVRSGCELIQSSNSTWSAVFPGLMARRN
jgi:hypothetical protein